jgi:hypothetical protein
VLNDRWTERCFAQRVHPLEGEIPQRAGRFGLVLARDEKGVYPVGLFEVCGKAVIYPPQTLNPREEESLLAAAIGLTGMWEEQGVLTLHFAKQRDGSDFALFGAEEELSAEARHLLTMRGLWDGTGASFLSPGTQAAPELLELPVVGVSSGETLYIADDLLHALQELPEDVQNTLTGWYETFLRHDG